MSVSDTLQALRDLVYREKYTEALRQNKKQHNTALKKIGLDYIKNHSKNRNLSRKTFFLDLKGEELRYYGYAYTHGLPIIFVNEDPIRNIVGYRFGSSYGTGYRNGDGQGGGYSLYKEYPDWYDMSCARIPWLRRE